MVLPNIIDLSPSGTEIENQDRFLVFKLAGELYASPLLQIREVMKMPSLKSIPTEDRYFKGVLNLRGQIISIIDLREKFDLKLRNNSSNLILVIESDEYRMGMIVDSAESVIELKPTEIDKEVILESKIPKLFFVGIGKLQDRLINLIDLKALMLSEANHSLIESP